MTTAIVMWLVVGSAVVAYAQWAAAAILEGANPWWYVAGAIVAYPLFITAVTGFWFTLAWIFRAQRPAHARIGITGSSRLFWNEARAIARFRCVISTSMNKVSPGTTGLRNFTWSALIK